MSGLFRQAAVEHQQQRLHGEVLVLPSNIFSVFIILLITWLAIFSVWLFTAEYARKETVLGWLEPAAGITKVYAKYNTGYVKNVFVNNGQFVARGEELYEIENETTLSTATY